MTHFPALLGWEATRDTLHRYANIPSVIEQAHLPKHPKWWHISLLVEDDGLTSHVFPADGAFRVRLDLKAHELQLVEDDALITAFDLTAGTPSTLLGQAAIAVLRDRGLAGNYKTEKFAGDAVETYNPDHAGAYLQAITQVDAVFKQHKARLAGETSPVQLWSHHFDLSVELFGDRQMPYEHDGETTYYPSQLNLGFSPGDATHPEPYFYSNPFPFEAEKLTGVLLPHGARWVTEGFSGSLLPYNALVGDEHAGEKLLEYAEAVYQATRPVVFEA